MKYHDIHQTMRSGLITWMLSLALTACFGGDDSAGAAPDGGPPPTRVAGDDAFFSFNIPPDESCESSPDSDLFTTLTSLEWWVRV